MRYLLGLVLFIVFYFVGCIVVGGIAGGIAGANDPHNAAEVGRLAGTHVVEEFGTLIAMSAGMLAIIVCCLPMLLARDQAQE